jgi:hypothetical protein
MLAPPDDREQKVQRSPGGWASSNVGGWRRSAPKASLSATKRYLLDKINEKLIDEWVEVAMSGNHGGDVSCVGAVVAKRLREMIEVFYFWIFVFSSFLLFFFCSFLLFFFSSFLVFFFSFLVFLFCSFLFFFSSFLLFFFFPLICFFSSFKIFS